MNQATLSTLVKERQKLLDLIALKSSELSQLRQKLSAMDNPIIQAAIDYEFIVQDETKFILVRIDTDSQSPITQSEVTLF